MIIWYKTLELSCFSFCLYCERIIVLPKGINQKNLIELYRMNSKGSRYFYNTNVCKRCIRNGR